MNILTNIIEDATVVYLNGRLDYFESESAESILFDMADNNPDNHMIIVLEGLDHLGSSGLRIFISLKRHLAERGKRLVLCNDRNSAVDNFFRIINIQQMFDIFRTESEAIRSISISRKSESGLVA